MVGRTIVSALAVLYYAAGSAGAAPVLQQPGPAGGRKGPAAPGRKGPAAAPREKAPAPAAKRDRRTEQLEKKVKALEKTIKQLKKGQEDLEIKQLVMEGKVEANAPKKEGFKRKTFTGHARALQGLNPEISLTGDLGGVFVWSGKKEYTGSKRSEFRFRGLGIHFQSSLDPFSFMKAAVSVSPSGVHFGEAYMVWTAVFGFMNITAGKFRQQLGVVNRWHKHALDQYDFPLMLTEPFGPGGLNQIGVSFEFRLPKLTAKTNELVVQVTNGMNDKAFAGQYFSIPTTLVHYKNYWDLSRNTYLEFGLTGIAGFNNRRGDHAPASVYTDPAQTQPFVLYDDQGNPLPIPVNAQGAIVDEDIRVTAFGGADLTLQWEPVKQSKYRNVIWRTEFLYGYKQLADGPGGEKQKIHWMGGYTYLQSRLTRSIEVGVRGDLAQPFVMSNSHHYIYQVAPYFTWWQSPWAKLHLEYWYTDGDLIKGVHTAIVQVVFAAGPHKHERY